MKHGNHIILYIDGQPVAGAKSNDLDKKRDTIEVCSPVDGKHKKFVATTSEWATSVSGICKTMAEYKRLEDAMDADTPVAVRIYDRVDGEYNKQGSAIITSLKMTASNGSLVTFSASLQGSGALDQVKVEQTYTSSEEYRDKTMSYNAERVWFEVGGDDEVFVYKYTFTKRTLVEVHSNDAHNVLLTQDDDIEQVIDTDDYMQLTETGSTIIGYNEQTKRWVEPGTLYVVEYVLEDVQRHIPTVYALS